MNARHLRGICAAWPATALASFTSAQESPLIAPARPAPALAALAQGAGIQQLDGELWGLGRDYRARFDARGVEFTPALGAAAPRNLPLRYELRSIERGASKSALLAAEPEVRGAHVIYARGVAEERYEVLPEGLEQSFVLAELPHGDGDLVVRGRIETELEARPDGDGLVFELAGIGGVRFGGVVGIDARGMRAPGRIRCRDGEIEMSLPASFVETAALPLTLDPLIGSSLAISSGTDGFADVAYDLSTDAYLVVWQRTVSSTDTDVMMRSVSSAGAMGSLQVIASGAQATSRPVIANVRSRAAFVVAYSRSTTGIGPVAVRSIRAGTSAVGPETPITAISVRSVDIGGVSESSGDVACCVWIETTPTFGTCAAMALRVDSSWMIVLTPSQPFFSSASVTGLAISKSSGAGQHFGVAITALNQSFPYANLWFLALDRSGRAATNPWNTSGAALEQGSPDVDGDGSRWVVAWESRTIAGGVADIHAASFLKSGSRIYSVAPPGPVVASSSYDETQPSVCCTGDSYLLGYTRNLVGARLWQAFAKPIEYSSCADCEPGVGLGGGAFTQLYSDVAAASRLSGGRSGDGEALISWVVSPLMRPQVGGISAHRWSTRDGTATEIAPSCGTGGLAFANCARLGHAGFTCRLRNAAPGALVLLLLNASTVAYPCGSCLLMPDPSGGVLVSSSTDPLGSADVPIPIPDWPFLAGVPLFAQWLTLDLLTPSCAALPVDMSSALRFVIE